MQHRRLVWGDLGPSLRWPLQPSIWAVASSTLGGILVVYAMDSHRVPAWGLGLAAVGALGAGMLSRPVKDDGATTSWAGIGILASLLLSEALVEKRPLDALLLVATIGLAPRLRFPSLIAGAWTATALAGASAIASGEPIAQELIEGRLSMGFEHPSILAWLAVASTLVRLQFRAADVLLFALTLASGARVPTAVFALALLVRAGRKNFGLLVLAAGLIAGSALVLASTRGVSDLEEGNGRTPIWTSCVEQITTEFPKMHTTAEVSQHATDSISLTQGRYQFIFNCHESYLDLLLRFGWVAPFVIALFLLRQIELVALDFVMAAAFAGLTFVSSQMVEPLTVHSLVFAAYARKGAATGAPIVNRATSTGGLPSA